MTEKEANIIYLCEKSEWPLYFSFDYYNQYIQWYTSRWGRQRPKYLPVTWLVRAVTYTAEENSSQISSPHPPPPRMSPLVVRGARSIQGRQSSRERGENLRVNHHLGHTEYTDSVQTVHQNEFFHKNSLYTNTVKTVHWNQFFHKNCLHNTDCTVSTQNRFQNLSDAKWRNLLQDLSNWRVKIGGITDLDSQLANSKH